jgi:hypothetical protein
MCNVEYIVSSVGNIAQYLFSCISNVVPVRPGPYEVNMATNVKEEERKFIRECIEIIWFAQS